MIAYCKNKENELVNALKEILDSNANFARSLSEFWKGLSKDECELVNHYGVWFSGEGGSQINGEYAAHYYDLNQGQKLLLEFLEENDLKIYWYDCATPVLLFKEDKV